MFRAHKAPLGRLGVLKGWKDDKQIYEKKRAHTSSLASRVTFAPRLTTSTATALPIPLDPPVICTKYSLIHIIAANKNYIIKNIIQGVPAEIKFL